MNKIEKKIVGGQFLVYLWPFESRAKCYNYCGSVIFPASQKLFSLCNKKQLDFLYVTFFSSYYYETANFFMNRSSFASLPICYDSFWYAVAFNELSFLINEFFCGQNIAGING